MYLHQKLTWVKGLARFAEKTLGNHEHKTYQKALQKIEMTCSREVHTRRIAMGDEEWTASRKVSTAADASDITQAETKPY